MKIRYREAGGFAGLSRGAEVDTASLPDAEARRVTRLVQQAALGDTRRESAAGARDLMGYEIVIERESGRTVARFDDATVPEAADELLEYLQGRARPIPLK
jgi:hypothetical protein